MSVAIGDVNGDGRRDVLLASFGNDKIAWYANSGGSAPTFTPYTVTLNADGATSVCAVDLDGDGDTDILTASYNDDTIAWYENDGNQNFTQHVISSTADGGLRRHRRRSRPRRRPRCRGRLVPGRLRYLVPQ